MVLTVVFCFPTKSFAEGYPNYKGYVFDSYQSFLFGNGTQGMQDPKQKINLTKPRVLNTLQSGPVAFGSNPTTYPSAGSLTFYDGNSNVYKLQFTDEAAIQKFGPSLNAWVQNPGEIKIWCNGGAIQAAANYVVFIIKGDGKYDFLKNASAVPVGECKISDLSTIVPNQ